MSPAAKSKKTPAAARALAIEGLGKTVKLQFLGNFEDRGPIWTLGLLLDDADAQVREKAFAQLEELVEDTFEYKPDLGAKERKASMAKWTTWLTSRCGPPGAPP